MCCKNPIAGLENYRNETFLICEKHYYENSLKTKVDQNFKTTVYWKMATVFLLQIACTSQDGTISKGKNWMN